MSDYVCGNCGTSLALGQRHMCKAVRIEVRGSNPPMALDLRTWSEERNDVIAYLRGQQWHFRGVVAKALEEIIADIASDKHVGANKL